MQNCIVNLLKVLMRILTKLKTSTNIRADIFKKIPGVESKEEVLLNRLKLRYYFKELLTNQEILKGLTSYYPKYLSIKK